MPQKISGAQEEAPRAPRLFVHIPKTAGTSFRAAAESGFGNLRVLRDYGPASEATSEAVKREVYDTDDKGGILRALESERAVLLAGHFPVQKYGRLLGLQNTVTIFRDPVEQVISHYRHAVAHHGYEDTLLAFAERKGIKNLQTRFLFGLDPGLIGIVGITEHYRDSLALINKRWNWALKHKRKNVSSRFDKHGIEISDDERNALEALNQDDCALYRRACHVFENSLYCYKNRLAAEPRGAIGAALIGENLKGWAFDMQSDKPATVTLVINGENVAQANCNLPSTEIEGWKLPRDGESGFVFEYQPLTVGDCIEIRDADTGLVLDRKIAKK